MQFGEVIDTWRGEGLLFTVWLLVMSSDKKVCVRFRFIILHSIPCPDFFKRQLLFAHCHCLHSLPHSFLMSSSLTRGKSKIDGGFYPDTTCLPNVDLWWGGGGGKRHAFVGEAVICESYQRGLWELVGILRMNREFRAISPFLQFPSFTSPLSNSTLPLRGTYVQV